MSIYVPFHNHSDFSLLDSVSPVSGIVEKAKEMGFSMVGITDHGNISSHLRLQIESERLGIQPLFGIEIYVSPYSKDEKNEDKRRNYSHLVLIAKNQEGLRSLLRIVSRSNVENFYYRPLVDLSTLREEAKGLVATTACAGGYPVQPLEENDEDEAERRLLELYEILGEDLLLEIQINELEIQRKINLFLLKMKQKYGLKTVYATDTHYLNSEDVFAHDIITLIRKKKTISEKDELFKARRLYMKTYEEILEEARTIGNYLSVYEIEEALNNTLLFLDFRVLYDTEYKLPHFEDEEKILEERIKEGLRKKIIRKNNYKIYLEETKKEYELIREKGLVAYFLLYSDIAKFAEANNIPLGWGRGSAAGCLLSYLLGITKVDPLKFNLTFERFLSPFREDLPDIDIDISDEDRPLIIEYLSQRFQKRFYPLISFSRFQPRVIIREIGRVYSIPLEEVDKIAKLIPFEKELNGEKQFPELLKEYPKLKKFLEATSGEKIPITLEGLNHHATRHASGFVITPDDAMNLIPLYRSNDVIHCGFDYEAKYFTTEYYRLLKIDLLGLTSVKIIKDAKDLLNERDRERVENFMEDLNDDRVYYNFSRGDTLGCFQLESMGMRGLLRGIKPKNFEEISAAIALFRPTTLAAGIHERYVENKNNGVRFTHPILEEILAPTYGVIIYQEQVIELAHRLGGLSKGEADMVRKAMTKWQATRKSTSTEVKGQKVLLEFREKFIEGSIQRGLKAEEAEEIYSQIEKFCLYGFNKSHSVGYALLSCEGMFLKTYFPLEFFFALLRNSPKGEKFGKTAYSTLHLYLKDAKEHAVHILPPDINHSDVNFILEGKSIRCGLNLVKWVGDKVAAEIANERPYSSLGDFLLKKGKLNSRAITYLIAANCFRDFGRREEVFKQFAEFRKLDNEYLPSMEEALEL